MFICYYSLLVEYMYVSFLGWISHTCTNIVASGSDADSKNYIDILTISTNFLCR